MKKKKRKYEEKEKENKGKKEKRGKKFVFVFIIFVLLLISSVFATTEEKLKEEMNWTKWAPLIAIALGIGYGLGGIAYMLGQALRNTSLIAWSKEEIREVNMSAIIAAIIFFVIISIDNIYDAVVNPQRSGDTPINVATEFLDSKTSNLIDAWISSIGAEMMINLLAGPPLNLGGWEQIKSGGIFGSSGKNIPESEKIGSSEMSGFIIPIPPNIVFTLGDVHYFPFYGLSVYSSLHQQLSTFILASIAITLSYSVILSFIKLVAIPVLLPLGIFLRTFSLTRKLGSTLIAMGISLYIFFPVSMLVLKNMVQSSELPLPIKPSLNICGIDMDPGEIIKPFFGPDFECETGHMVRCVNCKILFGWVVDVMPLLKILCYLLTIIIWILSLAASIIAVFVWMLSVQLSCFISIPVVGGIAQLPFVFQGSESLGNDFGDYVLNMVPYVSSLAIPIIVSPVITLIIVITGIRSVSAAIGGEVTILGIAGLV